MASERVKNSNITFDGVVLSEVPKDKDNKDSVAKKGVVAVRMPNIKVFSGKYFSCHVTMAFRAAF